MTGRLGPRALNRATLQRQLLLERSTGSVIEVVRHLIGLQAQTTQSWYVGLWSRLAGFRPEAVGGLLTERRLVRMALMRSTIHLVTAADSLALRPLVQPALDRPFNSNWAKHLDGVDLAEVAEVGRSLVDAQPLTFAALGERLAERWPGHDPAALAQVIRTRVPLVQVPPRGVWGRNGPAAHTSIDAWVRPTASVEPSLHQLIRRYLAAFGPASVPDIQTWCGLTRLRPVVDDMRRELVTFRDERGRDLYDLPDAPRPDPDAPAPPRFLYDFDNLLLSHADRARVVTDDYSRNAYARAGPLPAALLIDGFTRAEWRISRENDRARLSVRPYQRLSTDEISAVEEEGARLLEFVAADASAHDIAIIDARP